MICTQLAVESKVLDSMGDTIINHHENHKLRAATLALKPLQLYELLLSKPFVSQPVIGFLWFILDFNFNVIEMLKHITMYCNMIMYLVVSVEVVGLLLLLLLLLLFVCFFML